MRAQRRERHMKHRYLHGSEDVRSPVRLPPYEPVNTRYGPMLVNRNDVYIGQALMRYGEYGEIEMQFLSHWIDRPGVVVEVGANIGSHTVALARRAAACGAALVAFEPQPFVFQNLCANLALNGLNNVRAWPLACGSEPGSVWFSVPDYRQAGNFGGVSMHTEAPAEVTSDRISVPCVRLDDMVDHQNVGLIKLDVEGFELLALQGATQILQRSRPVLYLENDRVDRSRALIEWLWAQEYQLWWHICPLFNPGNFRAVHENVYGNVASFNMVALPRESGLVAPGCAQVVDAGYHPLRVNT